MIAAALSVLPALPQTSRAIALDESDVEPQPGIIRLAGIGDADVVTLDGEEIPAAGLRRSRYNLLIAPGIYTVKVRYAETGRTCTSRVVVSEERTVEPACARQSGSRLAD